MSLKNISDKQVCIAVAVMRLQTSEFGGIQYAEYPENILHRMTGEPTKVCIKAIERACTRDFVDYGGSIRQCWLTGKGEKLLQGGGG